MLDAKQFEDLQEIFPTLLLFGDPAQLPPVQASGGMVFETLPETRVKTLERVHRQEADNPILDLAHALADPALQFHDFEAMVADAAERDERVVLAQRVEAWTVVLALQQGHSGMDQRNLRKRNTTTLWYVVCGVA